MICAFRTLWASASVSAFGSALTEVALPVLALFLVHATPVQLGLLVGIEQVAWLLLGLPAGVWVDRWPLRRVVVLADLGRTALIASIPVAAWLHLLQLWWLFVAALLVGGCSVFGQLAVGALVPALVDRTDLVEANARINAASTAASLSGSAIVGPIVALVGAPVALAIDAMSFLGSALLLQRLPSGERCTAPVQSLDVQPPVAAGESPARAVAGKPPVVRQARFRRELADGLRIVLGEPLFRTLTLGTAAFNACAAAQYVLGFLFLRELHAPRGWYGILLAAGGVGALIGSALVPRMTRKRSSAQVWRGALIGGPVIGLLVPLAQPGFGLVVYAVGTLGLSAAVTISSIIGFSARQAVCPPELLGRVSATSRMLTWGVIPLAATAGGWLAGIIGVRTELWVVAACYFAEPVMIRQTRLWSWSELAAQAPGAVVKRSE